MNAMTSTILSTAVSAGFFPAGVQEYAPAGVLGKKGYTPARRGLS